MSAWDKWAERIYSESDFGRSVATSIAGVIGLVVYLSKTDWVVAAFVTIIVFPVVRILASALQRKAENAASRRKHELEVRGHTNASVMKSEPLLPPLSQKVVRSLLGTESTNSTSLIRQ